ncbi:DUF6907 domain-containing protein [Streptomyces spectabilis]|uniref:DUF6907 domain-containing protein n=1 Tax=Streptomyces spectabilis TaxID=68270 RepID=UPI003F4CC9DC
MEITALCPPWCASRADGHRAEVLADRCHFGEEHIVELSRNHGDVEPSVLQVTLEQAPFMRTPGVSLVNEGRSETYERMSLPEARRVGRGPGGHEGEGSGGTGPRPAVERLRVGGCRCGGRRVDLCTCWSHA